MIDKIKNLPSEPGVYFFYDESDKLIYIGKSTNIKWYNNIFKVKIESQ